MDFYNWMRNHRIVAILRGIGEPELLPAAQALYNGGIRLLEVTMNTADAPHLIRLLNETFADSMLIGAGTVTDISSAESALQAGARFFVTPNLDEEVIEFAIRHGIQVLPGVMTPTEVARAYRAGAGMVKVFPASSLGVSYMKELQGPLGHIPMVAVGGVTVDNASDFIRAGAVGVGVGSSLLDRRAIASGNYDLLEQRAAAFVERLK